MIPRFALITILTLLLPATLFAAPALLETFDGPSVSWSPVPNRFGIRVLEHERVRQDDKAAASGAEFIRLGGPPGYSGLFLMPIGQAPVLDDLVVRLRLRSDRPGVLTALRVVFPRATDPGTGRPLVAIVRGVDRAEGNSNGEELVINDVPTLVRRHARALGGSTGRGVDDREAYVDAVVLIVPSDPRGTRLWIDELAIDGLLRAGPILDSEERDSDSDLVPLHRVVLDQRGFTINDERFYPRVITHQGEPLAELQRVGFNCVAFIGLPSEALLTEAARLKLQVFCPPPGNEVLGSERKARPWDAAIAWLVPGVADQHSLDAATAEVDRIRRADTLLARPILAVPTEAWGPWSRLVNGLVVTTPWSSPTTTHGEVSRHFSDATRFAQPGSPLLAAVSATHSLSFMDQVKSFAPAGTVTPWRSPEEVLEGANAAAMSGARGIWVTSDAPLVGGSSRAERTRLGLAMLNLQLTLLEPWLRDGAWAGEVRSTDAAHSAMILSKGRTRLVLPLPGEAVRGAAGATPSQVSYIVPGVAESAKAYEFTPVGLRPTAVSRLAGGAQVVAHDADSLLLLTDDAKAAAEVQRRVLAMSRRAEALQQAMAVAELRHAEAHLSPLVLASGAQSPDAAVLADARRWISHSKSAHSTGDLGASYQYAAVARRRLAAWNSQRLAIANPTGRLESSPLTGQPSTLVDHQRLLDLIEPMNRSDNHLPGGDFEDHSSAAAAGWRYVAREASGARSIVTFSDSQPAQGGRSLRIDCSASDPVGGAAESEHASVTITSPEVNLSAGQLIEITGVVRVESVSAGGALTIIDTLGGDELGLSINRPMAWKPFRLLRRASSDEPVVVTFSARGPITVGIDGVMIRPIELPSAAKAAVLGAPALQRK